MSTLFPIESFLPPGFQYFPAFITSGEEESLIGEIRQTSLAPMIFQGYEAKRKVASFGYDWNFSSRTLTKGKAIPPAFDFLVQKVARQLGVNHQDFAELLVTEYPEGSVINWHRDAPPFDVIAGISLLSDCMFRFRPYEKALQNRRAIVSFPLHRRSLYIISGDARSTWEHSISPVKTTRFSVTLRTLK